MYRNISNTFNSRGQKKGNKFKFEFFALKETLEEYLGYFMVTRSCVGQRVEEYIHHNINF